MMAFFLLMWLVNATSPDQKQGIADYFAPAAVSNSSSGSGGILGGKSFDPEGVRDSGYSNVTMTNNAPKPESRIEGDTDGDAKGTPEEPSDTVPVGQEITDAAIDQALAEREAQAFERAAMSLRQAMKDLPELAELSRHLIIDQTPEGMRIQIVDQEGRPMFKPGGSEPLPRTRVLLQQVAKIVNRLPNRVTISGHTDSAAFERADGYSNWELSSDRANAARRIILKAGVDSDRLYQVAGKAGSEPLFPDDPFMSSNRRISIVLLCEAPVLPPNYEL